ncbi:imelysin family protein [Giesbergeria sinuosa]|uniref:Imelysin family protein n=1 Tax=Giesbergeria sinuosa TaxID=80883 RepID=A0ABV9QGW4_9BURK
MNPVSPARRQVLKASLLGLAPWGVVSAQPAPLVFPYYSAAQALQGLYCIHLPQLAQDFAVQAQRLVGAASDYCTQPDAPERLHRQWAKALMSWQTLATPALGPVLQRRSQRQIDFWPTRPALLDKALARKPQTLAELASIGSPAKGFPALEILLRDQSVAPTTRCAYMVLLAQGIEAEAIALREEFAQWATRDWTSSEQTTQTSMAEWINQWLGGWERLRWMHIEQPLQKARTRAAPAAFARYEMAHNVLEWQTQWQALQTQALLRPGQKRPPQPEEQLIPIEALLRGKGHLVIANRWSALLGEVGKAIEHLTAQSSLAECLAVAKKMKVVTLWYQNEVAQALDIPLGFSDADGD